MGCCISERNKEHLDSNEQEKKEDQDKSYDLAAAEKDEAIKKFSFLDSFRTKALRIDDTKLSKLNKVSTIRTNFTQASSQSQSVKYKWKIEKDLNTSKIQDRIKILVKLNNLEFVFDNFFYVYHSAFNPIIKISDGRVTREYKNLTETKIDKKPNAKDKSFQLTQQTINMSGVASEAKSNKDNSLSQTEAEVLNLINTSMGVGESIVEMSTDDAGVILNFEDNIHSKEFVINAKYSKEIHNWLNIQLSNEIVYFINSIEMPLAVGYLPINLILFKHDNPRQPFNVKIPLINPIDDVVIAYLNVTVENNCEYEMLRPITEDIARSKLVNFYSSKNILNINDMDPFLIEKYFTSLNSHNKQHANEEANKNIYESFLKFLENLKLEEIHKLILEKQEKKLPYDWETYNPCNYYTFLTIVNEVFGKSINIRDLKDTTSVSIFNQITTGGVKLFNSIYFQPDFETKHSDSNCPIINNLLTIFVTFYKEKIHEKDYCEKELSDIFSIQNFFKAFGESYYKVLEKLSKYDVSYDHIDFNQEKTSNKQILNKISSNLGESNAVNFDSTDHLNYLLQKSIQNNFLKMSNLILETYLKQGMHPKKSMIFTSKKVFFQNELHCFKHKLKEYFLLNGALLKDSNFVFGVLKILISFVKFVKLFCYLNSFNHSHVYIDALLIKDNSLTQWILSVFNDYITNPRLFPMFLELVYEISQELKGIQFFHFKKYFELPLFTMNFTPYLKSTIKNELVLHFIIRIFLKFSSFTYNDSRQFIDFISLNCTEIALLYINCLNILLIITKEEKFSIFSQKFRKVSQIETIRLYSSKKIATKFYFSVFHIQMFTNILSILSNLYVNHFQFKMNFHSQNRIKMLKLVLKYIAAFVFFDVDYNLKGDDENEKNLRNVEENNKYIYYEMFEKSLNYIKHFVLAIQADNNSIIRVKSILKEVIEEICFNIHFDENDLWNDFMFNLSKKIERYCQADKLLKLKGKKKMLIEEINEIVNQKNNEEEDDNELEIMV